MGCWKVWVSRLLRQHKADLPAGDAQSSKQTWVSPGAEKVKLTHDPRTLRFVSFLPHMQMDSEEDHLSLLEIMHFYEASPEFPEFRRVHFADPKMLSPWQVSLLAPAKTFEAFERQ